MTAGVTLPKAILLQCASASLAPVSGVHRPQRDVAHYRARWYRVCAVRVAGSDPRRAGVRVLPEIRPVARSEEHPSELQSLMRISYAVFCLKTKKKQLEI